MLAQETVTGHPRRLSWSRFVRATWLIALFMMSGPVTAGPIAIDDSLSKPVDDAVAPIVEQQQAVGYAVGLIRDGKVVSLRTYGFEDRENKIPVSRETMFRWASISKTVTAVAALQLAEKHKLDLDEDIRELVPEFPDKGEVITSRQLLTHQGGIRHYANGKIVPNKTEYSVEHPFEDVVTAIDEFKESPLIATPGEKHAYSTHGFILLSAVVERAAKQPFASYVDRRIIRPLKMTSMQPDYQWVDIPHRAVGYRKVFTAIVPSTNTDVSWKLGGGGYISTIGDLALWAAALVRGELLDRRTWQMAWTPQKTSNGKPTTYGLGFNVRGSGDLFAVGHGGAQEKTRTELIIYPNLGIGAVAMTNSEFGQPAQVARAALHVIEPRIGSSD